MKTVGLSPGALKEEFEELYEEADDDDEELLLLLFVLCPPGQLYGRRAGLRGSEGEGRSLWVKDYILLQDLSLIWLQMAVCVAQHTKFALSIYFIVILITIAIVIIMIITI